MSYHSLRLLHIFSICATFALLCIVAQTVTDVSVTIYLSSFFSFWNFFFPALLHCVFFAIFAVVAELLTHFQGKKESLIEP